MRSYLRILYHAALQIHHESITNYFTTGKHGHGVVPHDRFEKAYYEKHPELIKKEIEQYHERPAWAMSSDDLNKIVRETASRGSGLGKAFFVVHVHCWKSLKPFLCWAILDLLILRFDWKLISFRCVRSYWHTK